MLAPVPDVVDLVVEAATMESVFAAQRLLRIDVMRRELLADAAGRGLGVTDIVERSIRLELAAAMRVTEYAAGRMIAHAEALVHRYPAALDSLAGGRITPKHAEILIDAVDAARPGTARCRWPCGRWRWRRRSRWAPSGARCTP